jgi:hypothetical protein
VGLLGVTQFEVLTNQTPARMKRTTIASLMTTMILLTLADSLIPTTSKTVSTRIMKIAGRLTSAPVGDHFCPVDNQIPDFGTISSTGRIGRRLRAIFIRRIIFPNSPAAFARRHAKPLAR